MSNLSAPAKHLQANGLCRHITLIDPGKQDSDTAAKRAMVAVQAGSECIFIGGSTDTPNEVVHSTCEAIKESFELRKFAASQDLDSDEDAWNVPIILFPGGGHALSPSADGILFMMLMNSRDRKFLVGEQVKGAPFIEKFGISTLPTGYVVCSPGGEVGRVGDVELIQPNEIQKVRDYALTAKMYGFDYLYLEAGSGAEYQVSTELIKSAKTVKGLTLIVGGGIRTPEQAELAKQAGADWIVTGTLTEQDQSLDSLEQKLREVINSLN